MPHFIHHEARLFLAAIIDRFIPTAPHRICFVTRYNVPLSGNLRIVLDSMATAGGYEIGFFKEGPVARETIHWLEQHGVRVMQRFSWRSLSFILSSSAVVLSHSARDAYLTRRKKGRRVINLWHGVALKRIEGMMRSGKATFVDRHRRRLIRRNSRIYDAVIASSATDRLVNAMAFQMPLESIHVTGLPRLNYLQKDFAWPSDLDSQRRSLEKLIAGRKFVLYAPTFRDSGTRLDHLMNCEDLAAINAFCHKSNTVFGIRTHPYRTREAQPMCDGIHIINASPDLFAEPAVVLASADALVVDYSSIWVDYLLLDRPVIAYVPDRGNYAIEDRGFIYDFDDIVPGPVVQTWEAVLAHLSMVAMDQSYVGFAKKRERTRTLLLPTPRKDPDPVAQCVRLVSRF